MFTYLSSLVHLCRGEGGTLQTHITGMCGECSQCLGHTEFAPSHGMCGFPVHIVQVPGCSARALSEAAPGLHALPRSKPLRFRFSGTPQRHRLGWACVLCLPRSEELRQPGVLQVHSPSWAVGLITSPVPAPGFPGCTTRMLCQVCRVSPLGS